MNTETETNRREFEEWAKQEGLSVDKRTEGYYNCGHAVVAWEAWQAAREQVTEQPRQAHQIYRTIKILERYF
jgi:hypothetical protein